MKSLTALLLLAWLAPCAAQESTRLYVFDNGQIAGLDTELFNFKPEELAETDFTLISYLIVHPRGTLQFDSGGISDAAFEGHDGPVGEGVMTADKPLLPQLAAAGYTPGDIDYFALSHYHSDHTGNANRFANATWIVQRAERDFMFGDAPEGIIDTDSFSALENATTIILDDEDYDVFGDGTVLILSAPGHTPGHQVLAVRLANAGWIVLAGDLYHYPEERTTGRTPTFEYDAEQSHAARARIENWVKEHNAQLWIEHDIATHENLPRAP